MSPLILLLLPTLAQAPAQGPAPPARLFPIPQRSFRPLTPADSAPAQQAHDNFVLLWNETQLEAIAAERTPPPMAARNLAIMHIAMYDAVNGVAGTHCPYLLVVESYGEISPKMAAGIAAHRVLVALYPRQTQKFDQVLERCCLEVADSQAKTCGVRLGQMAAEKVLAWRATDGIKGNEAFPGSTEPGRWRPTPPNHQPALYPHWSKVRPFALKPGQQIETPNPPPLESAAYTMSFVEVKRLGGRDSRDRTADQTEIARFWEDGAGTVTPPGHWNRIAQTVARQRRLSLEDSARLFALLDIALADAAITCWHSKYHHAFWRPVHGIREADRDGNPETTTDLSWTPLLPTPPFPAYTSGHSTFSGAAATVLAGFFSTDTVPFTSTSDALPGVTRGFPGFHAAAEEAGISRIYGGIHWSFDNTEGLSLGRTVGEYVLRHYLRPCGEE